MISAQLRAKVGRRGAALLFFTLLDFVYCYGLFTAPRPLVPYYAWMNDLAPLGAWAACWGLVGMVCLAYAAQIYDTIAFMCAAGLKVGWGLLALLGWMAGSVDRGYVSAVIWLGFAAFVVLIAGGIPPPPRRQERRRPWTL